MFSLSFLEVFCCHFLVFITCSVSLSTLTFSWAFLQFHDKQTQPTRSGSLVFGFISAMDFETLEKCVTHIQNMISAVFFLSSSSRKKIKPVFCLFVWNTMNYIQNVLIDKLGAWRSCNYVSQNVPVFQLNYNSTMRENSVKKCFD